MTLKVYGWYGYVAGHGYCRIIVATTSYKRLAKITGDRLEGITQYWRITHDTEEITAALSLPECKIVMEI